MNLTIENECGLSEQIMNLFAKRSRSKAPSAASLSRGFPGEKESLPADRQG
jgi:hypothetical protein